MNKDKGFSLIEMLMVITIIGILTAVIVPRVQQGKDVALYNRALLEFRSIESAVGLYFDANQSYPPDAERGMPPGLETYLAGGEWPTPPWPGTTYDWDNWVDPDDPTKRIRQISVRFCPDDAAIEQCTFPSDEWAEDFDVDSALYYCIDGACRAHVDRDPTYPGFCVNC